MNIDFHLWIVVSSGSEELGGKVAAGDKPKILVSYEHVIQQATQGDQDAQWSLYQMKPTEENLAWLCRAADQGHVNARNELGELYFSRFR